MNENNINVQNLLNNDAIKDDYLLQEKLLLIMKLSNNSWLDGTFNRNRLIKLLIALKNKNKLDIINEEFINSTQWFCNHVSYVDVLYAIYCKNEFYEEAPDQYLFTLTEIIMHSVYGNLSNYGKHYDEYFLEFNKILELYYLAHSFLNKDLTNKVLNRMEHHFFEIIMSSFLSYYYLECSNISLDKVIDTLQEIFNYHEFIEQWQIKGITKEQFDSYDKEKLIAKTLMDNITLAKPTIK